MWQGQACLGRDPVGCCQACPQNSRSREMGCLMHTAGYCQRNCFTGCLVTTYRKRLHITETEPVSYPEIFIGMLVTFQPCSHRWLLDVSFRLTHLSPDSQQQPLEGQFHILCAFIPCKQCSRLWPVPTSMHGKKSPFGIHLRVQTPSPFECTESFWHWPTHICSTYTTLTRTRCSFGAILEKMNLSPFLFLS